MRHHLCVDRWRDLKCYIPLYPKWISAIPRLLEIPHLKWCGLPNFFLLYDWWFKFRDHTTAYRKPYFTKPWLIGFKIWFYSKFLCGWACIRKIQFNMVRLHTSFFATSPWAWQKSSCMWSWHCNKSDFYEDKTNQSLKNSILCLWAARLQCMSLLGYSNYHQVWRKDGIEGLKCNSGLEQVQKKQF